MVAAAAALHPLCTADRSLSTLATALIRPTFSRPICPHNDDDGHFDDVAGGSSTVGDDANDDYGLSCDYCRSYSWSLYTHTHRYL